MPYSNPKQNHRNRQKNAQRVNLVTALADGFLALIKLIIGTLTLSHALIADGIHSLADLLTDIIVMVATHFGRRAPDKEHPYGHGRIETMASLWLGVVLSVVAGGMIWESIQQLFSHDSSHTANSWAIGAALLALLIKELLFRWTMRVAKQQGSPLLEASAWHSRTDSASSVIVLVGLIGTMMGWTWLDPFAALLVAILVAKIGFDTLWSAGRELIDTALPVEQMETLAHCAREIPDLKDLHDLRARRIGAETSLDIHLQVDPAISVTEAHEIGMAVTYRLRTELPSLRDVTFHIDSENDKETDKDTLKPLLPLRSEVVKQLDQCWGRFPCWNQRTKLILNYRHVENIAKRRIDIELYVPHDHLSSINRSVEHQLQQKAEDLPWIGEISLWQRA